MYDFLHDIKAYDLETITELRARILEELGSRICLERKKRNDSQELLGKALGVSKSTVSRYENGEIEIPSSALPIIAKRYSTSIARMFEEVSLKGALSEYLNIDFIVVNTINSMENELENGLKYALPISEYYSKLIDTESVKSFDMFYVILQLIDDLNNVVYSDNTNFDEGRIYIIFESFLHNIKKIYNNNYEKNPSAFYQEIVEKVENNKLNY